MYKIIDGGGDSNTGIIILISIIIIVIIIIVAVFLFYKNTDFTGTWYPEDKLAPGNSSIEITSGGIIDVVNIKFIQNGKKINVDNDTSTITNGTMSITFPKGKDGSQSNAKCTLISNDTMKIVATNSFTGTITSKWNKIKPT